MIHVNYKTQRDEVVHSTSTFKLRLNVWRTPDSTDAAKENWGENQYAAKL